MSINVLVVTHFYPTHLSGIPLVAERIARGYAEAGWPVTWAASVMGRYSVPEAPFFRPVPLSSIAWIEEQLHLPLPVPRPRAIAALIRAVRESDVVHVHDCLYVQSWCAVIAARLMGKRVVVTQHVGHIPYRSAAFRALMALGNRILGSLVFGLASRVGFCATHVLRYFEAKVPFRFRGEVIEHGVDTALYPVDADGTVDIAVRRELGIDAVTPVVLFVGRFTERKGLELVHAAAARRPELRFVLIGWGEIDPTEWRLPNVTVVGKVPAAEVARYYAMADLLLLPSVGEGFPLVVQEALSCGVPVMTGVEVASDTDFPSSMIEGVPLTAEDVTAHVGARLEGGREARALRVERSGKAAQRWSWSRCIERYRRLIEECVRREG